MTKGPRDQQHFAAVDDTRFMRSGCGRAVAIEDPSRSASSRRRTVVSSPGLELAQK